MPEPKKFTLALDINAINAVLRLLGKCPYEQVVTLINDISAQVQSQGDAPAGNADAGPTG